MLKNYFKIAVRQLQKQKLYASVKIGGFALSVAACLLIALYIRHEVSYDKYYPDGDRIYRVVGELNNNGAINKGCSFPAPFAGAIKQQFPEIELAARLMPSNLFTGAGSNQLRRADKKENAYEEGFTYADPQLLEMFGIPMVYGNRAHALDEPNTMVISKRKADKYFPGQNPVGKVMVLNDDLKKAYRIGGVMEDIPANSHLHGFDFLLTLKGHELWPGEQTEWGASNYENYIRLRPGTDIARLETRMLDHIVNEYYIPLMKREGDKNLERLGKSLQLRLIMQPVGDIHLYSQGIDDSRTHGDIRFIWLFGAIAAFILIIACINFINLSTAKSANRAKEVGLKKAIGAFRSSLIQQFLVESLLYSALSFIIGLLLAWLLLPYFNSLADKSLSFPWTAWWLGPLFLAAIVVIGLLAGIYPSFYLSSFRPIAVLKGRLGRGSKNSNLRSILVVFQFTASVVLIIGTFVIYRQMQFILNRKLGFEKDQVIMIQGAQTLGGQVRTFKAELQRLPQVKSVAVSDFLPVSGTKRNGNTFWKEGRQREDIGVPVQKWDIDHDYIKTMGMQIVAGRDFSPAMPSDSQSIIINQAMARKLFPGGEDPIGKRITNYGTYEVIGVVADFNFESMRTNIEPLCMTLGNSINTVAVKVSTTDMSGLIKAVTGVWKNFAVHQPFRYTFLDERFAQMYADVQRMGRIFTSFAMLAIIVACLGLFALSAFMAEQRSKEVSIRKVLGASVAQVTALISRDFVKLVLIAVVLATPVAWWAMNQWLQDFAYRTEISWWMFPATGLLVVLIALVTISFQSIKAAVANPVESLRAE